MNLQHRSFNGASVTYLERVKLRCKSAERI